MPPKLSSYAKIAAMPIPNIPAPINMPRKDVKPQTQELVTKSRSNLDSTAPGQSPAAATVIQKEVDHSVRNAVTAVQRLSINSMNSGSIFTEQNAGSADSCEEDQSQISSSSLNKPQSFDTKSLASVTTFAMDDKESIRPDDSASVRAVDDENPHSTLSRNSSFQHEQDQTTLRTARVFPSNVTIPGRRFPTLANPPRFGNLPISPVLECTDVQMPEPALVLAQPEDIQEIVTVVNTPPDEKLLDALASAKDRLPLLQLEEKLLSFLQHNKYDVLDLPPQNSFNRLLTHKLADYYHLAHTPSDDNASVRILRAAPRALPTPLTEIAKSIHIGTNTAPGLVKKCCHLDKNVERDGNCKKCWGVL